MILHVRVIQCRVYERLITGDTFNPLPPTSHDRLRTRREDIDKLLAHQALWELFFHPILSSFHFEEAVVGMEQDVGGIEGFVKG